MKKSNRCGWLALPAVWLSFALLALLWLPHIVREKPGETAQTPAVVLSNLKLSRMRIDHVPKDFSMDANAALEIKAPQARYTAFGVALNSWIVADLEGALRYVRKLPSGPQYDEGLFMVLGAVCKQDPARAIELAGQMAVTPEQLQIYSQLFSTAAAKEFDSALSLLQTLPEGTAKQLACLAVADARVSHDLEGAWNWAQSVSDPQFRAVAFQVSLEQMAESDPNRAILLAQQNLSGDALSQIESTSIKTLSLTDAVAAAALVKDQSSLDTIIAVTKDLDKQAPDAVLPWVESLPAGIAHDAAFRMLLNEWGAKDPESAAAYVAQMPIGDGRTAAATDLAKNFSQVSPTEAVGWAVSLTDIASRNAAVVTSVSTWSENDPQAAMEWAMKLSDSDPARTMGIRAAYSYWKLQDGSAAVNFAQSLSSADRAAISE